MKTTRKVAVKHAVRLQAVQSIAAAADKQQALASAAAAAGVTVTCVRRWCARHRAGTLRPQALGRKPKPVARERRQGVIAALLKLGPMAGVNAIRALFRDVPYRQIAHMKRRLRRVVRRRRGWRLRRLEWLRSGAAWAMDFTKPKGTLPLGARRAFMLRDLGSRCRLASVLCSGERASVATAVLSMAFAIYGPPLALKSDLGPAFRAHETQALLQAHQVAWLPSPPYTPSYNGAIERSLGFDKQRAAHFAELAGRAGRLEQEDFDHALVLANTTLRPWGANGPTPADRFAEREAISAPERGAFQRTWREHEQTALMTRSGETRTILTPMERCAIRRKALQKALCELAYLRIRIGRISTPITT